MKRRIKIIVALLLLIFGKSFAQQSALQFIRAQPLKINMLYKNIQGTDPQKQIFVNLYETPSKQIFYNTPLILPDYYTRHFGFFCQKELQLEKTTRIPVRFRLGSLEYCNKLEGKSPWLIN